MIPTNN